MGNEADTNSGTVPNPVPEVRDEGPGGTDLGTGSNAAKAEGSGESGTLPNPVRHGSSEGSDSGD